jgi:VanZ family protein
MIRTIKNNILSIVIAFIILFLSLANSNTIEEVTFFTFPYIDKVVHFGMYLTLMLSLLYEHRYSNYQLKGQLLMAVLPAIYGILLEIIQKYITETRSGDIVDALFNVIGVLVALSLWRFFIKNRRSENQI